MTLKRSTRPLCRHIPEFLDYCEVEKGLAANTQRNYKNYLQLLSTWLDSTGSIDLLPHELTPQHIWDYRLYLAREHKSPTGQFLSKQSQNLYLTAFRALLDYLARRDIDTLPSSQVTLAKQSKSKALTFLETDDVLAMLEVPDTATPAGLRNRTIMELFFSSGLRISELVALNVEQFSMLNDNDLERTYELSIVGKGGRPRTIFISPRAAHWLRVYLKSRRDVLEPLLINYRTHNRHDRRLSPRAIQKMISRSAALASVAKHVTPHTLRHSYATDLLSNGADLRAVQELLGHKNVATTQIYTHVTNKHLRDIHERFHGGNEKRLT